MTSPEDIPQQQGRQPNGAAEPLQGPAPGGRCDFCQEDRLSRAYDQDRARRPRRRFQFSLWSLLVTTTVVAIGCSTFIAAPPWVGAVVALCLMVSTPVVLITVLIYGRGYARTFCIGGLVPSATLFGLSPFGGLYLVSPMLDDLDSAGEARGSLLVCLGIDYFMVLCSGLLAIATRWIIETRRRRGRQQAGPDEQTQPSAGTAPASQAEHK